jgi:hypothetical protein
MRAAALVIEINVLCQGVCPCYFQVKITFCISLDDHL